MTKKLADIEVPISKETRSGMSLNIDDQKWIKVLLDLQNDSWSESFDKNISELTGALAEVIQDQNKCLFNALARMEKSIEILATEIREVRAEVRELKSSIKEITNDLTNVKSKIKEHEFRIESLEKKIEVLESR